MSTSNVEILFADDVDGAFAPTSVTLGVVRADTGAVVVAAGTAPAENPATGQYRHSWTDPAADLTYTATWTYVIEGETYSTPKTVVGGRTAGGLDRLTFGDLYGKLVTRWGMTADAAKERVREAYRAVLRAHNWSFLSPATTLSVLADVYATTLPAGFKDMIEPPTYVADGLYRFCNQVSPAQIRTWQAASDLTGYPEWYAIEPVTFLAGTGQQHQVRMYPRPNQAYTFNCRIRLQHTKLTADADYPLGGDTLQDAIEFGAHMMEEPFRGLVNGPYRQMYADALAAAVAEDQLQAGGVVLGKLTDGNERTVIRIRPGNLTEVAD